MVKGVQMFGRGRDQAGVLIEPSDKYAFDPADEQALVAFRNAIWYGPSDSVVVRILSHDTP